jgi:putative peptidoglycan lipid II flippase
MTGMAEPDEARAQDPDATVVLPVTGRMPYLESDPTVVISPVLMQSEVAHAGQGAAGPEAAADRDDTGASVARHGSIMAIGSIVSRATGFLRTAVIGAAIGALAVSNNYNTANTLPNMVYEMLLGGVLASVIVPLLVRARGRDADRGEAYTQRLFTLATVALAGATVVAVAAAPLLTRLITNPGTPAAEQELITKFSYLLLPEIFFYGMAALFAALLNTRGHFAAPMWTPILNNLVVIMTAGVFMLLPTASTPPEPHTITAAQILVLGVGTTLGIVVQASGLWPYLRRVGFRWRWRWDWRELHLRELARVSTWMLIYVGVSQVALLVVLNLAQRAADQQGAGWTIFNNAYLVFMMAHGIVAVSIITALMPRMSVAAAERRYRDLAEHLSMGTRLSAVVLVPVSVLYIVVGRQLAVVLFNYRAYSNEDAITTGWVIAASAIGLVPFAISQLQVFAFYAMPDTRTPALINIPVVALRIAVDVLLYVVLPATLVAAGLMIGNAISFVLATALGYWLLRRRIGRLGLSRVAGTLARLSIAAVIAAVPAALIVWALISSMGTSRLASLVQLTVGSVVLLVVYVTITLVLRVPEVRDVAATVRARLGR